MNDWERSLVDLVDDARMPSPPSIEDLRQRARRHHLPHRRHRPSGGALKAAALISAAAVLITGVVVVVAHGQRRSTSHSRPLAAHPAAGPDVIALGSGISQPEVAARNGKLWVTGISPDQGPSSLEEFDENTGKLLSKISVPDNWPGDIALGDNAIWLRTQQGEKSTHLVKIDPTTHTIVLNVTLQKDGGLAVTRHATWTVNGSLGLLRIDPESGRTVATIPLPGGPYAPLDLTSGPLGVFLGSPYDGSILRVNTQTNTVTLVTHVGTEVDRMVELGTSLWVSSGTALVAVPLASGTRGRTIHLGAPVLALASDGRFLWVATDRPRAGGFRVNPLSGQVKRVTLPAHVAGLLSVTSDPTTGETWATAMLPSPSLVLLSH